MQLQEGGRIVTRTKLEAAMRSTLNEAIKGRPRAQEIVSKYLYAISKEDAALESEHTKGLIELKIWGEEEVKRRTRLGITDGPEIFPHPDNIVVNLRTGEAHIKGPMWEDEKIFFEKLEAEAEMLRKNLTIVRGSILLEKSVKRRRGLEELCAKAQARLDQIEQVLS